MIWLSLAAAWMCLVAMIVVLVQAAHRVAARAMLPPQPISSSFADGLIENCSFKWDPARKTMTITPANPGTYLTVQDNVFDCADEITFVFAGNSQILRSTVQ